MRILTSIVLLVLATSQLYAQEFSKFNVGLNLSTSFASSVFIAPSANYEVNQRFEVGLAPAVFIRRNNYDDGSYFHSTTWGVNFTGKFYIYRENKMDPYTTLLVGFGQAKTTSDFGTVEYNSQYAYSNFGALLGNELELGANGWFFDFNIGLIWGKQFNTANLDMNPFYSLGIKKRFFQK